MAFNKPAEIADIAINIGVEKVDSTVKKMLVLGFLGGAFIALGFLLDIRVMAAMPAEWGSFVTFLGAAVFPLGLILVLLAGADLITGNMMTVPMAFFAKKINISQLLYNWFWVTVANLLGALFVAFAFGHFLGLTETGVFLDKTIAIADAKIGDSFLHTFVSAIGCNWLVCLACWLCFGANDFVGKILGIWFPVMAFVTLGFQHVVANMFVIPAAIFAGHATWMQLIDNVIPAFLGNAVGGALFVGAIYFVAYNKKKAVNI
ncbi:formate/nitrite transporter family protein [Kurthia sibirica]|uniref:Formate/nitrite transporter n=1 Tax=Kurthia sibirica TaxID=202750 RepID=A0A2U3AKT7_9BACL|nr:formate/nitrite transporter family protein [Kurthia sibirica]PWI25121.1 formate/nitrite transporter [Kurthia sibirica]GEK34043.1 putative transporter YrhG [Kurthia sibirica]